MPSLNISISGEVIEALVINARTQNLLDRFGSPSPGKMVTKILTDWYEKEGKNVKIG